MPPPSASVPSAPDVYTFHKKKRPLVDKYGNYFSPKAEGGGGHHVVPTAATRAPPPPSYSSGIDYDYFDDSQGTSYKNAPGPQGSDKVMGQKMT